MSDPPPPPLPFIPSCQSPALRHLDTQALRHFRPGFSLVVGKGWSLLAMAGVTWTGVEVGLGWGWLSLGSCWAWIMIAWCWLVLVVGDGWAGWLVAGLRSANEFGCWYWLLWGCVGLCGLGVGSGLALVWVRLGWGWGWVRAGLACGWIGLTLVSVWVRSQLEFGWGLG